MYKKIKTSYSEIKKDFMIDTLNILKEYVDILSNSKNVDTLAIRYFTIIHNFIILEFLFKKDVDLVGKNIIGNLDLKRLKKTNDILALFNKLYSPDTSIVRTNIETLDNIDSVREYLKKHDDFYTDLINYKKYIK